MEAIKGVYFGCVEWMHHTNYYNFIVFLSDISRCTFTPGQDSF